MNSGKLWTLGHLTRETGLARASLLHYESLGVLKPAQRSAAGYRLYGEAEVERLRYIRKLRNAGVPLTTIADMLVSRTTSTTKRSSAKQFPATAKLSATPSALLQARLLELSEEADRIRRQQRQLAQVLASKEFRTTTPQCASKSAWVALLQRAGFSDTDMEQWHREFEAQAPAEHAAFLKALGLSAVEVKRIRAWSRQSS